MIKKAGLQLLTKFLPKTRFQTKLHNIVKIGEDWNARMDHEAAKMIDN